jgi:sulfatase maturation enzyme AslB (radical SAM superfamily)
MSPLGGIESLQVILTSRCNLRCSYCYQNARKRGRMSWKTLRAALDLALDSAAPDVGVTFAGGEPLLEFPLIRRAVAYVERNRPRAKIVTCSISTNGTLLTNEIIAFLEEHRIRTQLSFDGAALAQDLRGPGTFSKLDRTLDRLLARHQEFYESQLRVALTANPLNVPYLADSVAYFLGKEVEELSIMPSISSDAAWEKGRIGELDAQFARMLGLSLAHERRTGKMPVGILRNIDDGRLPGSKRQPMCGIGQGTQIVVDVDGEVYGCNLLVGSYQRFGSDSMRARLSALRMGRVDGPAFDRRRASFPAAVKRSRIFDGKDRKYSAYGSCKECRWFDRCFMCPACIPHVPGSEDPDRVSDFYCAFNQVALKYRSRAPLEPALPERVWIPPRLAAVLQEWRALAGTARAARRP